MADCMLHGYSGSPGPCDECKWMRSRGEEPLVVMQELGMVPGGKRKMMECKKHPKYQAKRVPTSKCKACMGMWLKSPHRPLGDARAVAEAHSVGGSDAGGRARK